MKISLEDDGTFLPSQVLHEVTDKVVASLSAITTSEKQFVVNDSLYFRESRRGKITPCVVNSAAFLSSAFQANLANLKGAEGETAIGKQSIDGLITTTFRGAGFKIADKDNLLQVIHGYIEENKLPSKSIYTLFPKFYGMFVDRGFYQIDHIPERFHGLFETTSNQGKFRIGVEFETGNIASSFRAINKLFVLFQDGQIDAGVFVTSTDKRSSATRIWPVSNRNGSFQELTERDYQNQVSLPLVCIGFAPDKFCENALFLGQSGNLFKLKDLGKLHASGRHRILLGEANEEILSEV